MQNAEWEEGGTEGSRRAGTGSGDGGTQGQRDRGTKGPAEAGEEHHLTAAPIGLPSALRLRLEESSGSKTCAELHLSGRGPSGTRERAGTGSIPARADLYYTVPCS